MGHKFLSTLAPIDVKLGDIVAPNEEDNMHDWGIKGLLSRNPQADPPSRSITCFCVNGRVVQLPKLAALLRKLWTGFAGRKKPSCVLALTLPNCSFDINLSPDKQQILLLNEDDILDVFSAAVSDFFSSQVNGKFIPAKSLEQSATEELVEKERQKHKRRFAFVHDLSKAKLQHDLEDRESTKRRKIKQHDEISSQNGHDGNRLRRIGRDQDNVPGNEMGSGSRKDNLANSLAVNKDKEPSGEPQVKSKELKCAISEVEQNSELCAPPAASTGKNGDSTNTTIDCERTKSPCDTRVRQAEYWSSENQEEESDTNWCRGIRHHRRLTDHERQKWTEIQSKFRANQSCVDTKAEIARSDVTSNKSLSSDTSFEAPLATNAKDRSCQDLRYQQRFQNASSPSCLVLSPEKRPTNSDYTSEKYRSGTIPKANTPANRDCLPETGSDSIELSTKGQKSPPKTITGTCNGNAQARRGFRSSANIIELSSTRPGGRSSTSLHWAKFSDTVGVCAQARVERVMLQKRREDLGPFHGQAEGVARSQEDEDQIDRRGTSQPLQPDVLSLSKAKFRDGMKVLGQFNLGFILCLCHEKNLWIFDQHACDEKYNFEKLRRETKMHEQKLLKPIALELTSSQEACILDHMDLFESNGFRFEFRPNAPIRRRLLLTTLPHSGAQGGRKAVQFGEEDVKALCAMLSEGASYDAGDGGTGTDGSGKFGNNAVRYASMVSSQQDPASNLIARLPKAISMFASRSCRSSIMIGTALSHTEMNNIVSRLADVEFPWTCPHGRPTLRHVGCVSTILHSDEGSASGKMRLSGIVVNEFGARTNEKNTRTIA